MNNYIIEKYPDIFINIKDFKGKFKIEKGWEQIITGLCAITDYYIKSLPYKVDFKYLSFKKRFGILDIDYEGTDPIIINKFITTAKKLSYKTCEECSGLAYLYSSTGTQFGKLATLCPSDALKKSYIKV